VTLASSAVARRQWRQLGPFTKAHAGPGCHSRLEKMSASGWLWHDALPSFEVPTLGPQTSSNLKIVALCSDGDCKISIRI